jgi:hypothetical protein
MSSFLKSLPQNIVLLRFQINVARITLLTYARISVYTFAQHMHTSIKMIEDHYGHVLLRKKAHEIAGSKATRV